MKLKLKRGTTGKRICVFVRDATVTDNVAGMTALVTTAAGLQAYYRRDDQADAYIINLIPATTLGTWQSGGWKEVSATKMPGVYELGLPDAVLASGDTVHIMICGAAGMVPILIEIELDGVDYKTGQMVLSSVGLDQIPVTSPVGAAATFREMMVQVWRRFFKKAVISATALTTFADNGITPITSQTVSDDGVSQTQGTA